MWKIIRKLGQIINTLIFNKKYGYIYLIINIVYAFIPLIMSIIHGNKAWTVTLTILFIYLISHKLASSSYNQNKALGKKVDPNIVLKAFSFSLSLLAVVIYSIIGCFSNIPIESVYIYGYGIVSFLILLTMLSKNKKNKFDWSNFKELICGNKSKSLKGIVRGIISGTALFIFVLVALLIYVYKALSIFL